MRTVNKRIVFLVVIAIIFFVFVDILMFSMFSHSEEYAMNSKNSHLFSNGVLVNAGTIKDTNGVALASSKNGKRYYSSDSVVREAMLHALGDDKGYISGGVENTFRKELCGYNIVTGVTSTSNPTLYLTLDSQISADAYEKLGEHKGCIIVANYKTGKIIAMATSPSYDIYNVPDDIEDNEKYEGVYIDRIFKGLYTPGSTFKTVTSLAAIENISDIYDQTFTCNGSYKYDDGEIICMDTHGTLTFQQALNRSCNVAFAQIANEVGASKLESTFNESGLANSYETPDRITTQASSFGDIDKSSKSQVGWTGIGQYKTLVNPYAYLIYMCAIANGGTAYKPYYVDYSKTSGGRYLYQAQGVDSGVKINSDYAKQLKELMRSDVRDYYGDYMFGNVTMCGKSGTAQVEGQDNSNSLFVGFSYDDSFPYASVAVVENAGAGLKYAGQLTADIMNEIYNKSN